MACWSAWPTRRISSPMMNSPRASSSRCGSPGARRGPGAHDGRGLSAHRRNRLDRAGGARELRQGDIDIEHLAMDEGAPEAPVIRLIQNNVSGRRADARVGLHIEPGERRCACANAWMACCRSRPSRAWRRQCAGHTPEAAVRAGHRRKAPAPGRPLFREGRKTGRSTCAFDHANAVRRVRGAAAARPVQQPDDARAARHAGQMLSSSGPHRAARGHGAGHRPDRQRQDHDAVLRTQPSETADTKILTAEDPVEYRLDRINQVQINAKIGLDFARVLRTDAAPRSGHHPGRRNARSGNRRDRSARRDHRPPRVLHAAHDERVATVTACSTWARQDT